MKSIEDRVVAAIVHGLIAAAIEAESPVANRAIELTKDYLEGKEIDGFRIDDEDFVEGTIQKIKDTFGGAK